MHVLPINGIGGTKYATRFGPVFKNYTLALGTKKSESNFEIFILHNTVTRENLNTKEMVQAKVPSLRLSILQGTTWYIKLELTQYAVRFHPIEIFTT
jgi:hypothetical protein